MNVDVEAIVKSDSEIEATLKSNGEKDLWASCKTKYMIATQAVGHIKLENKIGTRASDLPLSDPLRIIATALQRSIRLFGSTRSSFSAPSKVKGSLAASFLPQSIEEGLRTSPSTVEFERVKSGGANCVAGDEGKNLLPQNGTYNVPQPAFRCSQLHANEFKEIRGAFGIPNRQFFSVLELQNRLTESDFSVIKAGDTAGKSPSFFFLSSDQRFILKSCTKRDVQTLGEILSAYRAHLETCTTIRNGNSSLLPRYLALYRLEFPGDPTIFPVTIVVMTNFFAGVYEIHRKFDLKGSTHNRFASEKERAKKSPVYKDNDWLEEGRKLTFTTEEKTAAIRTRLARDTEFLARQHLIDYSLLVGIHENNRGIIKDGRIEAMGVVYSRSTTEIRYFGIVDILTPYILKKRAETFFMGTLQCQPGISCQPPNKYQRRFMEFSDRYLLATEEDPILDEN